MDAAPGTDTMCDASSTARGVCQRRRVRELNRQRVPVNRIGGREVGRHSGAVCTACQQRILVREGRLIEHQHLFPTLGRAVSCVGSLAKAPGRAAALPESRTSGAKVGLPVLQPPMVSRPSGAVSS